MVVILRGRVRWIFFDENGDETESVVMETSRDGNGLGISGINERKKRRSII